MNKAINDILDRAEEYADRKGDPTLRDELKVLEKTVTTEFSSLESELKRCRELISVMAAAAQKDSDTILALRHQLGDEQNVIARHSHGVRRVKRGQDIVVQVRTGSTWDDRGSYNEMANDYAHSDSAKFANFLMHQQTMGVLK